MITIPNAPAWLSLGWIIALLVLVLDIVFLAINQVELKIGLLIAGLAIARLL